jgi:hypothetical protein
MILIFSKYRTDFGVLDTGGSFPICKSDVGLKFNVRLCSVIQQNARLCSVTQQNARLMNINLGLCELRTHYSYKT